MWVGPKAKTEWALSRKFVSICNESVYSDVVAPGGVSASSSGLAELYSIELFSSCLFHLIFLHLNYLHHFWVSGILVFHIVQANVILEVDIVSEVNLVEHGLNNLAEKALLLDRGGLLYWRLNYFCHSVIPWLDWGSVDRNGSQCSWSLS